MKRNALSIILFVTFVGLFSCQSSPDFSKIQIGMTYEEVESVVGKPSNIMRGWTTLNYSSMMTPFIKLKNVKDDSTLSVSSGRRIYGIPEIMEYGQLIYITWVFDKSFVDTFTVLKDNFREVGDSVNIKTQIYLLGGKQIPREEYNKSDGYEYRDSKNKIIQKDMYEIYKKSGYWKMPEPKYLGKKIIYKTEKVFKSEKIPNGIAENKYTVRQKQCIIFEAQSGRVSQIGFMPIDVSPLGDI